MHSNHAKFQTRKKKHFMLIVWTLLHTFNFQRYSLTAMKRYCFKKIRAYYCIFRDFQCWVYILVSPKTIVWTMAATEAPTIARARTRTHASVAAKVRAAFFGLPHDLKYMASFQNIDWKTVSGSRTSGSSVDL